MTLDTHPKYPSASSYVLKLRRDAASAPGDIAGLLENLLTGCRREFGSGDELIALLVGELNASAPGPKTDRPAGGDSF